MNPLAFSLSVVPSNDIDHGLANHVTSLRSTENSFAVLTLCFIEYILVRIQPVRLPWSF